MQRYFIVSTMTAPPEVLAGPYDTEEAAAEFLRAHYSDAHGYSSCSVMSVEDATDWSEITRGASGG